MSSLRLGYHRKNKAVLEPRIDVIHYLPNGLPRLLPRTLRIVSRDVRETFAWRPDFVSVSDPVKTRGGDVIACKKFLGNAGIDSWAIMKPCSMVTALFWPHRDEVGFVRKAASSPLDNVLIINLMDRMENRIASAVNIPPGKYQTRFLTESLPRGIPVAYLGKLPDSFCRQPFNKWRELSTTEAVDMQLSRTTTFT